MVTREHDDFVIVSRPSAPGPLGRHASGIALMGPGLDPGRIPFASVEAAIARGRDIAQSSRVSLWDATSTDPAVLVATFRR